MRCCQFWWLVVLGGGLSGGWCRIERMFEYRDASVLADVEAGVVDGLWGEACESGWSASLPDVERPIPRLAIKPVRFDRPASQSLPVAAEDRQRVGQVDVGVVCDPDAPPIDRLLAAVRLQGLAEAAEAKAIADLAVQHRFEDTGQQVFDEAGRKPVRVGVEGQLIDEALSLEIACAKKMSVGAAAWLLRDIVNLKTRHPRCWAAVQDGTAPLWLARQVASACAVIEFELTRAQAAAVDFALAGPKGCFGRVGWGRLKNVLKAAIMQAAPEQVAARAARRSRRWCDITRGDDLAGAYIDACLDFGDAQMLDQMVDRLANIMGEQGDMDPRDTRRAKALAVLASPARAQALLDNNLAANTALPETQVYVHIHDTVLADTATGRQPGVCRVERHGPAMADDLKAILGHSRVRLTPVVHLADYAEPAVDAYEIPQRIRERIINRARYEVFPYSSRQARHQDLDHTIPYKPDGPPGQTRPSNLGPLSRQAHRAKTHAGWKLQQPTPGVFHWTTGLGQQFQVGPTGTTPTQPP